ncbi:OLC1v1024002C1 [Oldenlandia corymbosa var. corymbosa]|uniref:OLC1v1024002C1 n=1 Tax=Oldenlandia corymbosa var. corymbosa TaxID=529605 RepID=A0AAV1C3N4_OLDCO|nr:OLC1v1024002C1 [Oldenlandia corymbosa var. corymbosa]
MRKSWAAGELARALISAASHHHHHRTQGPSSSLRKWGPALEQILHQQLRGCTDSLTPTLVAGVIDPHLLHHHSLALGFFNWAAQQPGFSHTSASYNSILKSLCFSRQFNHLEKLLKQYNGGNIQSIHPSVYGPVLSTLISGRKTHLAFSVFLRIRDAISCIGLSTCNSLLAALSAEGNLKDAHTVFVEMLQRGIPLTTLGFGVFLWKLCRYADHAGSQILQSLDDVINNGDASGINGSIIAVLVAHGLCSGPNKRPWEATPMLDELRTRGCKPDFIAYRIVAEAFRETTGCTVDVTNALKKKRKLGVAPRADDYKEFIFALIGERLVTEANELGQLIVSGNFPIEDDVLGALISSVSPIDPCSAVSFLKYMMLQIQQKGEKKMLSLTLPVLSVLSENLCGHGMVNELVDIFEDLSTNHNYFVDSLTYNLKLTMLCKAGRLREAYDALHEMKRKGLPPDISSYNTLLQACCRDDLIRPAKRLWDEMFTNGCKGNLESYSILIHKFLETGEISEAHKLFCQMMDRGLLPDESIYASLLAGLCQAKQVDTAVQVFYRCVEQDAKLGNEIVSAFITNLCRHGLFPAASNLLMSEKTADLGNLVDVRLTFLNYLAEVGEVELALDHLRRIGDISPRILDAVLSRAKLSFSALPKLKVHTQEGPKELKETTPSRQHNILHDQETVRKRTGRGRSSSFLLASKSLLRRVLISIWIEEGALQCYSILLPGFTTVFANCVTSDRLHVIPQTASKFAGPLLCWSVVVVLGTDLVEIFPAEEA